MEDSEKIRSPLELNDLVKEEIRSKLKEQNLEYRTKIVEEAMTPLIEEVTAISEHSLTGEWKSRPQRKKEKPQQKLSKLIHLVDMATRNFLIVGEEIAHENPDFQEELLYACDDVRSHGELLQAAAAQFSQSPCEPDNRSKMTKASKDLLLAVTRLLVVADMADVNKLLEVSSRVEMRLKSLHTVNSDKELAEIIDNCASDMSYITQRVSVQPNEEKSETKLQMLATAQMEVKQARRMLACTSKAFIQFSGAKEARENQEYVVLRLLDSLKTLSLLASGDDSFLTDAVQAEPGELVLCFKRLEESLDEIVPLVSSPTFSPKSIKAQVFTLQEDLNKILTTSAQLAASQFTRDHRQHALITLCGYLKTSLSRLVSVVREVDNDAQQQERRMTVSDLVTEVGKRAAELQRELCMVAMDQLSDVFMSTLGPLVTMCETAQEGREQMLQQRAAIFEDHANNMQKTALLICSLSEDPNCNKQVKLAARNIHTLLPQVVNAAYILVRKPSSIVGLKSMSVFKETWTDHVSALTDAMDSITPVVEFMAVTEAHVCEDGQRFLVAAETCNTTLLNDMVEIICNKCRRLCHVVKVELKSNKSSYTQDQIRQSHGAMEKLKSKSLSKFRELAIKTDEILHVTGDIYRVDFKGLEECLQRVVDNIRNVRRSILVTRAPEELEDNESDLEDLLRPPRPLTPTPSVLSQLSTGSASTIMGGQVTPRFQRTPQHSTVFEMEDTSKSMMSQLPPEHQAHLAKVTEGLSAQHAVFEAEMNKWDESGNDIVMLAKEMCGMMVDMSDFTRGMGPLHSTTDVIVTAKDIARAAGILDGVARSIADHCPDGQCQRDIYAYLDRVRLYCHQLNITANVKADLKSSVRDTVENASTLITTSKNLMTAIVDTVKTCYIASTAIARIHGGSVSDQFVQWRLTLPRKKKLYRSDSELPDVAMERSAALYELNKFKGRPREPQMSTVAEIPHQK